MSCRITKVMFLYFVISNATDESSVFFSYLWKSYVCLITKGQKSGEQAFPTFRNELASPAKLPLNAKKDWAAYSRTTSKLASGCHCLGKTVPLIRSKAGSTKRMVLVLTEMATASMEHASLSSMPLFLSKGMLRTT
uniref:Uncharacterized protein n=1 Tax=Rhipicephalus microplus TaxID=6941 RepID=A0A6G5AFW3_RHIMP